MWIQLIPRPIARTIKEVVLTGRDSGNNSLSFPLWKIHPKLYNRAMVSHGSIQTLSQESPETVLIIVIDIETGDFGAGQYLIQETRVLFYHRDNIYSTFNHFH